jgi:hypothetical protein
VRGARGWWAVLGVYAAAGAAAEGGAGLVVVCVGRGGLYMLQQVKLVAPGGAGRRGRELVRHRGCGCACVCERGMPRAGGWGHVFALQ